jgi:hypothetical protein
MVMLPVARSRDPVLLDRSGGATDQRLHLPRGPAAHGLGGVTVPTG